MDSIRQIRIAYLKYRLRKVYCRFQDLSEHLESGNALSQTLSNDVYRQGKKMDAILDKLSLLDTETPAFRFTRDGITLLIPLLVITFSGCMPVDNDLKRIQAKRLAWNLYLERLK